MKEKICLISLGVLFVIFLTGGIALAGKLATPPIYIESGQLICSIVNVSDKARNVEYIWGNIDGTESTWGTSILLPGMGQVNGLSYANGSFGFCKFIVEGKKKHFRASGCVQIISGFNCTDTILAR